MVEMRSSADSTYSPTSRRSQYHGILFINSLHAALQYLIFMHEIYSRIITMQVAVEPKITEEQKTEEP